MRLTCVLAAVPLALALCASTAGATTIDVRGFGTAGLVLTDNGDGQYARDTHGDGADNSGDMTVDSRRGARHRLRLLRKPTP